MFYLLLSVFCASGLVLLFKFFEQKRIPIFQAIVFNYWSAGICAFIFLPDKQMIFSGSILHESWLPLALGLGSLFIIVFNLTSITTVRFGVSTASVASKLGLVFPVILAFVFYGETFSSLKLTGILLAFVAVILSSVKQSGAHHSHKPIEALLPFWVFIGSGACDSFTQFATIKYLGESGIEEFSLMLFVAAALAGSAFFMYGILKKNVSINRQSIFWGAVLGFVNYFSFLFLLKALATLPWGSSVIFPLNNLGVVAFSTVAGVVLFKERITPVNLAGLFFAAASIITIVLAGHSN
jgi:drug/metabolite transporter (DMT)-like permease